MSLDDQFHWTPERVAFLRKHWLEHGSGWIAKQLGVGRGAVCGKADRISLPRKGRKGGARGTPGGFKWEAHAGDRPQPYRPGIDPRPKLIIGKR